MKRIWMGVCCLILASAIWVSGQESPFPQNDFEISPVPAKGDLDGNGRIDATDLGLLLDFLDGTSLSLPAGADADMNSTGTLEIADAVLLRIALSGGDPTSDATLGSLKLIEPGTFWQGSPNAEVGHNVNEGPQFQHALTLRLAVMETEVTRRMWRDLRLLQPGLPVDPLGTPAEADLSKPAVSVSWYQAVLFANLLSVQRGYTPCYYTDSGKSVPIGVGNYTSDSVYCDFNANGFRLPTEGEWEYFARAGTISPFPFYEYYYNLSTALSCATNLTTLTANGWWCYNSGGATHDAGGKSANAWGLKDVCGNAWEWCWDWEGAYPTGPQTDYRGNSSSYARVLRGGGADSKPIDCRCASRIWWEPGNPQQFNGFRLVRTVH